MQRILRHANVSTTQGSYIKAMDEDVEEAMKAWAKAMRRLKVVPLVRRGRQRKATVHQYAPQYAPTRKAVVVN